MTSTSASPPNLPVGSQGQPITVIGNKYRLSRRLGGGSFGDIYLGSTSPRARRSVSQSSARSDGRYLEEDEG